MIAEEQLQKARAAQEAGRLDEAETLYRAVLDIDLDNFAAAQALGLLLVRKKDFLQAEAYLTHALHLNSSMPLVPYALALAVMGQGRPGDALINYERALVINPDYVEALNNRGLILLDTILKQEALDSFDRAVAVNPSSASALHNSGRALASLGRTQEAKKRFEQAAQIDPRYLNAENIPLPGIQSALAYFNLGTALQETKRLPAALAAYDAGLERNPNLPYLRTARMDAKMRLCDWRQYDRDWTDIAARIRKGEPVAWPFQILASVPDPAMQLACARNFVADRYKQVQSQSPRYDHERIRIAYMSSDFRNHPVAHLIAGVLEQHDRGQFETFGISLGPDDGSASRKRLEKAFDRFLDGRQMSDADIAAGIRDLEIDILVDLNGLTTGAHTSVLAHRPAPVQVNFLGYPGTMGADYVDYIIADRVIIPAQSEIHFSEKIAAMPVCYQPNSERPVAQRTPTRTECGLPEKSFVFCAFNSSFKITPEIFSLWMRLLQKVPDSVLWLRDGPAEMRAKLLREAKGHGVSEDRLIFAPSLKQMEDHLARHAQADLFLDTLHYNAHTTASDALWSGLPVLTCPGRTYASRVSASLLHALGLPELIARSPQDYEDLALSLAKNPIQLTSIKAKLVRARKTSALFDSKSFTRDLESAYHEMWTRQQEGLPPASFDVEA